MTELRTAVVNGLVATVGIIASIAFIAIAVGMIMGSSDGEKDPAYNAERYAG